MPDASAKGDRRERQAQAIYEDAGYDVERATGGGHHSPDYFGAYDLIAIRPNSGEHEDFHPLDVRLVQVKSNEATGVREWMREQAPRHLSDVVQPEYAVCYDRLGWRLLQPEYRAGEWRPLEVLDERELESGMGDGLLAFLKDGGER